MQKCCPVLIEKNTPQTINSFDNPTSRIVCGSWSSDIEVLHNAYGNTTYASVKEKIEDAMRDVTEPFENKKSQKKIKVIFLILELYICKFLYYRKKVKIPKQIFLIMTLIYYKFLDWSYKINFFIL